MSRAAGLCKSCGGPRRGRAARPSAPIGRCENCNEDVCIKHALWVDTGWWCRKCATAEGREGIPAAS